MTGLSSVDVNGLGRHVVTTRNADIYQLDEGTYLKLFLPGTSEQTVIHERDLIELARTLGATGPQTYSVERVGDRIALLMERAPGKSLTSLMESALWKLAPLARDLARQHLLTHQVKAPHLPDVRHVVADLLSTDPCEELGVEVLEALRHYILGLPDGDSLLHMDFHTENVFSDGKRLTTIDWATAARGHAAADVAMSTYLLTSAEPFPGASWIQVKLISIVRGQVYKHYSGHYLSNGTVAQADIDAFMPLAWAFRLASLNLASERQALLSALRATVKAT